MNIVSDGIQMRSTIPKKFVEEFAINTEDKVEWSNPEGKLKGELKRNE